METLTKAVFPQHFSVSPASTRLCFYALQLDRNTIQNFLFLKNNNINFSYLTSPILAESLTVVFASHEIWNVTLWNIQLLDFPVHGTLVQVQKQTAHKSNCCNSLHLANYHIMAVNEKSCLQVVFSLPMRQINLT